jgi:L-asparaginase
MKRIMLAVIICIMPVVIWAQKKPRVIILATGGTIAGSGASADRAAYTAGKLPVNDLIGMIPTVKDIADISGEQISSVGSQDMTVDIWLKLYKRISEIFKNNEADGIVITHGTDTQEETAYFLDLTVASDKPVVLTGSMRPATAISADGPKNLYDAIVVAADPQSKGKGVMVSFDERIFDGRDVVKLNTTNVDAFGAPNTGPIGQVYDGKVMYYTSSMRTMAAGAAFSLDDVKSLPRVDIAYMYADAPPTAIDAFVSAKAKGIVIAGVGNGNFNKAFYNAVGKAVRKGVVVMRASRVPSGRVTLYDEIDDKKLGTLVTDDLNPQKARILLMLALTHTKDKTVIQDCFFKH